MVFHGQRHRQPVSHVPSARITGRSAASGEVTERVAVPVVGGRHSRARAIFPTFDPAPVRAAGTWTSLVRPFHPGAGSGSDEFAHSAVGRSDGMASVTSCTTCAAR